MTNEQKKQVRDALVRYANKFATQTLAAESLEGISATTISQVKNNNWELLSDRLWYTIAKQVGFYCGEWEAADTGTYLLLRILFGDAQHYNMIYGIAMNEGMGKTFTASRYVREQSNVYHISCSEEYNRRSFMSELLNASGISTRGSVPEMMQLYVSYLGGCEETAIIFDDADKLKDRVLHLVVLLANELAGKCGVVIMGNEKLRSRIIEGVRLRKVGFDEIYKSIGRRFITLDYLGPKDVEEVCHVNGVYDEDVVAHIKEESNNNLHNTTQLIIKHTTMNIAA